MSMKILEFPVKGRKALKLSDTNKLQRALDNVQGSSYSHIWDAAKLQKDVEVYQKQLLSYLPAKEREGAALIVYTNYTNKSSFSIPLTYAKLVWAAGGWRVVDLSRCSLRNKNPYEYRVTPEQSATMYLMFLDRHRVSLLRDSRSSSEGALNCPMEDLPKYLGSNNGWIPLAKVAAARLHNNWR